MVLKTQYSPTSSLQRQFWLAQQQDEGGGANNIAAGFILHGRFDFDVFVKCFRNVMRRHPALRTCFELKDGALLQCLHTEPNIEVCQHEINEASETLARGILAQEAARPFDLATGPLVRITAVSAPNHANWTALGLIFHHIAVDYRSKEILSAHLAADYALGISGGELPEKPEPTPYAQFAEHEQSWLRSPEAERMLTAWRKSLEGRTLTLPLSTDSPRPDLRTFRGNLVDFALGTELSDQLALFCSKRNADPYVALLAAYFVLFSRYSNCENFAVGIPLTNRRSQVFENTVGCFVNILPISILQLPSESFEEIMRKVRRVLLEAHRNQELPTERIVAAVDKNHYADRNPLYQIGFTVEPPMTLDLIDVRSEPFHCPTGGAQLDFFLRYWPTKEGFLGQLRYNSGLFRESTALQVANEFKLLVQAAIAEPSLPIEKLSFFATALRPAIASRTESANTTPASTTEPQRQIAIAATFTAEPMQDAFEFGFERLGWSAVPAFAPFNQIFQELVNPSSLLRRNTHGANVIFLRFDDLVELTATNDTSAIVGRLQANLDELIAIVQANAPALHVPLCVVICPSSPRLVATLPDEATLRARFVTRLQATPGVNLLTPEVIANWYPVEEWHEASGEELGHIPYTPRYLAALATSAVRTLNAINQKPVKALIIDCDGTLWDGVVGEEGPEAVIVGPLQKQFQEFLLTQHRAGILLCLCSKNHEADAWAVFDRHPNMVLKREHIAFARINWLAKSVNLLSLAAEINIDLNTFAFLDDNALERAEVRAGCPTVLCPELPVAWKERVPFLKNLWPLDHLRVTGEDKKRTEHYRSERLRADLRRDAGTFGDFLTHLELVVEIRPATTADIDRLAQLTIRTNQFNSTVRRLTVAEVASHVGQTDRAAFVTQVRDRFGDYGLVGAAFAQTQGDTLTIDPLLLSCRALGRGVEHRMAAALGAHAIASGCAWVDFSTVRTDRNEPARTFLQTLERLCTGTRNTSGTLRVAAPKLESIRFKPEEHSPVAAPEPTTTGPTAASTPLWDANAVQRVTELTSADTIFAELTKWRQQRHRRPTPLTRPSNPTAPHSDTEQTIATAWKKTLALAEIGTNENFFEVGGTSILAAQLALELRRNGLAMTIVDLFHYPTIAMLARNLNGAPTPPPKPAPVGPAEPQPTNAPSSRQLPAAFERLRRFRGK